MSISINADTWLIILHARVRGVETRSTTIRTDRDGERSEKERNVTQTIENVGEYEVGQTLVARLRSLLYRDTKQTPIGALTDGERKTKILDAFRAARAEVDEHNAQLTSKHVVEFEVIPMPISTALDAGAQRLLCEEVVNSLTEVKGALQAGDFKRARAWVQRNKNLDSLMPFAIAAVVQQCIGDVAELATTLRKAIDEGSTPEAAGAALNLEVFETAVGMIGVAPTEAKSEAA